MPQDNDIPKQPDVALGQVSGDYHTMVHSLTDGRYAVPGVLAGIAIAERFTAEGDTGLFLVFGFENDRAEIAFMTNRTLLMTVAALTRVLYDTGALQRERLGALLAGLLDSDATSDGLAGDKDKVH